MPIELAVLVYQLQMQAKQKPRQNHLPLVNRSNESSMYISIIVRIMALKPPVGMVHHFAYITPVRSVSC